MTEDIATRELTIVFVRDYKTFVERFSKKSKSDYVLNINKIVKEKFQTEIFIPNKVQAFLLNYEISKLIDKVIKIKNQKYFRWHDAGDIQSVEHLRKIFAVAILTPNTKHWLPTQERKYLLEVDQSEVPDNLIIRLSGSKINGSIPNAWEHTSSVVTENAKCPSANQDGKCMDCRMCWSKDVKNISYGKH